jgi:hypothetical protein
LYYFEYDKIFRKRPPIKTAILGVTNPLLVKAFAHWPTILKVTASSWEEGSLDRRKLTLLARGGGSMGQLVAEVAAPIIVAATAGGGGGAAAPVKQLHTRLLAAAAASLRRNRSLPREARNSSGIELKLNNNNYEFGSSVEDNDENRVEIEKQHKQKPIK